MPRDVVSREGPEAMDEPGRVGRDSVGGRASLLSDGGQEPTIELTDARALSILNAEHASLVASRTLAYNEGFVRTGMFLTAVSAALVALGFVAQAIPEGNGFQLFAVMVLTLMFVLGLTTLIRVVETSREDLRAVQGMNRIRRGYFDICPPVTRYFSTSDRDDLEGITASYEGPAAGGSMTGAAQIVHGFGTAVGMVGLMVSLIGGALLGFVCGLLGAPFALGVLAGLVGFLLLLGLITVLVLREVVAFGASLEPRFPSGGSSEDSPGA
jgi:hypothetical protein